MRWSRSLGIASVVVLASCASPPPKQKPQPQPTVPPQVSVKPPSRHLADDQCKAGEAMALIGKSRREIPVPVLPALQRVACTTCPITMDYNPRRLNYFFDAETGVIKEVRCG